MAKHPKTHVVMLLDETGSMQPHIENVVSSFNKYVDGLKKEAKRCYLSLYKFDRDHRDPILRSVFENRKVKECHDLTVAQYSPRGMTPLYDAVAQLIERTKERLPKDAKVLFVIHTDGQENASRLHNQESVKALIQKMEKKRGWTFIYLGEGAAAWNAGYDFGVQNVANFSSGLRGQSMTKLATATVAYSHDANVGGAHGASAQFYGRAGLDPDDIDPNDSPKVSSTVQTDKADDRKSASES